MMKVEVAVLYEYEYVIFIPVRVVTHGYFPAISRIPASRQYVPVRYIAPNREKELL